MPIPQAAPLNLHHTARPHQAPQPPRSQMPIPAPRQLQQPRDASSLHPVFFTQRLQRLPPPLFPPLPNTVVVTPAAAVPGVSNPVAHGYVYRSSSGRLCSFNYVI
ncbi:hypothetical protein F5Y14DRAFT_452011 [Nemania sp. NC0429]|nr:hypothetical protein F5Y14DRAFT_452011 [Nemania sp. NC0429]